MRNSIIETSFTPWDAPLLAELHHRAFPDFFLSRLGAAFLTQFYLGFIDDPTAVVVLVRGSDRSLQGVAVGTTQPDQFFRRLLVKRWPGFMWASLRASLRNPKVIQRLVSAVFYRGDASRVGSGALLSSICVGPESQGQGLGRVLVQAWGNQASKMGQKVAYLTTDALGNEAVNALYVRAGWIRTESFSTKQGRLMNVYTLDLTRQHGAVEDSDG